MTTTQILELDYREEENKIIIQKVLHKVEPLSRKFSDEKEIPIEALEKVLYAVCKKYECCVNGIYLDSKSGEKVLIYTMRIISTKNLAQRVKIDAMCLYELFAKAVIKLHSDIRTGKLEEKQ